MELNVFKPLIGAAVIRSINLLSDGMESFTARCLDGMEPDERRIAPPSSVEKAYSFGKSVKFTVGNAFLIDQDGIVIHYREMNRWSAAQEFTDLIQALLDRQRYGAR